MEGYILVDKPAGWTSFDMVHYIRGIAAKVDKVPARKLRVGHAGTLDPFATGLLIVLVGRKYTAQASRLLVDKSYTASICLDKASSTGDPEGEIRSIPAGPEPSKADIRQCLKSFVGTSMQTPPAFSAVKVDGVRAYHLARNNQPVKLRQRQITIHRIQLLSYNYPAIQFSVSVSSGTYIRTLTEDIGKALGRSAYTTELVRTSIGPYLLDQAVEVQQITPENIRGLLRTGNL